MKVHTGCDSEVDILLYLLGYISLQEKLTKLFAINLVHKKPEEIEFNSFVLGIPIELIFLR